MCKGRGVGHDRPSLWHVRLQSADPAAINAALAASAVTALRAKENVVWTSPFGTACSAISRFAHDLIDQSPPSRPPSTSSRRRAPPTTICGSRSARSPTSCLQIRVGYCRQRWPRPPIWPMSASRPSFASASLLGAPAFRNSSCNSPIVSRSGRLRRTRCSPTRTISARSSRKSSTTPSQASTGRATTWTGTRWKRPSRCLERLALSSSSVSAPRALSPWTPSRNSRCLARHAGLRSTPIK